MIYGSLFLCGIYYCLRVFLCAAARMSGLELEPLTNIKFLVKLGKSGNEIREMLRHLDIVRTVYHLVIYMQSSKIHKVF